MMGKQLRKNVGFVAFLTVMGCGETGDSPELEDDFDGDGFVAGEDCDDANAETHPSAVERCDAVDNNCDGRVDEGMLAMRSDVHEGHLSLVVQPGVHTVRLSTGVDVESLHTEVLSTYDAFANLIREETFSYDDWVSRTTYDHVLQEDHQPETTLSLYEVSTDGSQVIEMFTAYEYDASGRLLSRLESRTEGGVVDARVERVWGDEGRPLVETHWATNGDDVLRLKSERNYAFVDDGSGQWQLDWYGDGSVDQTVAFEVSASKDLMSVEEQVVGYPLMLTVFEYNAEGKVHETMKTGGSTDVREMWTHSEDGNVISRKTEQRYEQSEWQDAGYLQLSFTCVVNP